ncbi:MAG: tetratricopeptide repeat protein [Phycisphaerales bacterium]
MKHLGSANLSGPPRSSRGLDRCSAAAWNGPAARVAVRELLAALAIGLLVGVAGCGKIDPADLPPVPAVQTDSFPPAVQEQLDAAMDAVESRPTSVRRNGELAMMLQTYRQFAVAEIMYARTRQIAPNTFKWAYLHAITLTAVGELDAAERAFARAIELDGDYDLARIRRAEVLSDLGRTDEARAAFEAVLPRMKDVSEARFAYGQFLIAEGDPAAAIEEIQAAMRISGDFGSAHYQLAVALRALGKLDEAEQQFLLAEERRTQPADGSDRYINELLPLNRNEQPFVQRAKILAEAGRLAEAREFIDLALERNPESLPAHVSMMGLAVQLNELELFETHRAQAEVIGGESPRYWYALGLARSSQQRWQESFVALERARQLDPIDPNTLVQLAIVGPEVGVNDRAREGVLRRALEIDPAHPVGNWLLGERLSGSQRAEEAVPLLRRAVEREHPARHLMYIELARALARTGDGPGANEQLDLAEALALRRADEAALAAARRLRAVVAEQLGPRGDANDDG